MSSVCRYSAYDNFAWVYNRHWGSEFLPIALAALDELALCHIPNRAHILDLCCGTGQLAHALTERGYKVTGVDGSEGMLKFARQNAPQVRFILDDARTFNLPATFQLIVSVFDSLNHILNIRELTEVFRNVYASLREGGLFLFDLLMEEGFKTRWEGSFNIIEDDHVCIMRNTYSQQTCITRVEATIFRLKGGWNRSELVLLEKCYSEAEVRSTLAAAGFADVKAYVYDEKSGPGELTAGSDRAFFLCRKS